MHSNKVKTVGEVCVYTVYMPIYQQTAAEPHCEGYMTFIQSQTLYFPAAKVELECIHQCVVLFFSASPLEGSSCITWDQ